MAKIYVRRIKAGLMTIEEVPERWHAEVQQMLDEEGVSLPQSGSGGEGDAGTEG